MTNLAYAIIQDIRSISLLVTEIETSPNAYKIDLRAVSKSMYSEAFGRYDPKIFQRLFLTLLDTLTFIEIPELQALGRFILVDGSIFPAFCTMGWANYKSDSQALKMHLAFELNRMIPVQFISSDANSSEKKMLLEFLEKGVTYIADRGYISFKLFKQITDKQAFFIIRLKSVIKVSVAQPLEVVIPSDWQGYFSDISDTMIYLTNDKEKTGYRLVKFIFENESYSIISNRTDLTTGEIIMLYAYRWQIELFFRSIKRTFNALHLWSHSERGIAIQFYIYLIVYLLLLNFKQKLVQEHDPKFADIKVGIKNENTPAKQNEKFLSRTPNRGIVTLLGARLKRLWKISIHWMKCIQNMLFEPLTPDNITKIIATK